MKAEIKKILVVDDEKDLVELLEWNLRRKGYQVMVAYDGEGAISMAKENVPDLILLDFMLPGIDGMNVLSQLHKHDMTRNVPIVMITARRESALIFEAIKRGATDVMHKPFSVKELMCWVERWLSAVGLGPVNRHALRPTLPLSYVMAVKPS